MSKQNYSPEYGKAARTSSLIRRHAAAKKKMKKRRQERSRIEAARGDFYD
jgi:hypothetical protein